MQCMRDICVRASPSQTHLNRDNSTHWRLVSFVPFSSSVYTSFLTYFPNLNIVGTIYILTLPFLSRGAEFKELRKQWRQAKKEAEDAERERERQERAAMVAAQQHHHHHQHHHHNPQLQGILPIGANGAHHPSYMLGVDPAYEHAMNIGAMRRRGSQPYPSPHHPAAGYAYAAARGGMSYEEEHYVGGGLPSPVEDVQRSYHAHPHAQHPEYEDEMYNHHHPYAGHPSSAPAADSWHHTRLQMGIVSAPGRGSLQQQQQAHAHAVQQQQQASYFPPTPTSASAPAWDPHPHAQQMSAVEDEEPLLTNHVSLGNNTLPRDSTLLTALPGFGGSNGGREETGVERWEQGDV